MKWYEKCNKFYVDPELTFMKFPDDKKFVDTVKSIISDNRGKHIKITAVDAYGVSTSIETKVFAFVSSDESDVYILRNYDLLQDVMDFSADFQTGYYLISIDENLNINCDVEKIRLSKDDEYKCEMILDDDESIELSYKEWENLRITTIMTNLVIKSGFSNKFSTAFNELPTDLINKALELGCKIKIKPCENASLKTGLYRLTIILPKKKDYTEEKWYGMW